MKEQTIVILGGGFAGVRAAIDLSRYAAHRPNIKVILVDKEHFHTYHASLYEVASLQLRSRAVCIPFSQIFAERAVEVVQATVQELRPAKRQVVLSDGKVIEYDLCVEALGSVSDDFHIPGIANYGAPLKEISEASDIGERLHHLKRHGLRDSSHTSHVVIGGGGFAGVELAGELAAHFAKHNVNQRPQLTLIEAGPRLIANLPEFASYKARKRLEKLGVTVMTDTPIKELRSDEVVLASKKLHCDLFCWTGGVRANPLAEQSGLATDKKGRHFVLPTLQSSDYDSLYVAGDSQSLANSGADVPMTAMQAIPQGSLVARNIIHRLENLKQQPYASPETSFIVPVGKDWAIFVRGSFWFSGWTASALKRLTELNYLFSILPPRGAIMSWRPEARLILPN